MKGYEISLPSFWNVPELTIPSNIRTTNLPHFLLISSKSQKSWRILVLFHKPTGLISFANIILLIFRFCLTFQLVNLSFSFLQIIAEHALFILFVHLVGWHSFSNFHKSKWSIRLFIQLVNIAVIAVVAYLVRFHFIHTLIFAHAPPHMYIIYKMVNRLIHLPLCWASVT